MSAATADMARFAQATPHAAADVSVGRVRMFSTTAWMAYRRDEAEWQRRGTAPRRKLGRPPPQGYNPR